jgi:hypothetical protein
MKNEARKDFTRRVTTKESNVKQNPMGFAGHPVTSPSIVVPRKSRWLLTNKEHPNFHWWMKSLITDYVNKKIKIEVYDDSKGDVFNWSQDILNTPKTHGPLHLAHLDGHGTTISSITFSDLKLVEHLTEYEYGTNDVLLHKVTVGYSKVERQNEIKEASKS